MEEYVAVNRCFKCSRYNHRDRDCIGEDTCPLCAGRHRLTGCTATRQGYKCINFTTYSKYNPTKTVCPNLSSLDKKCPSLQTIQEKYRQNTDY